MELAGTVLLVALGGALGGVLRAVVTAALDRPGTPWGTLFVNVSGSGAAGFAAVLVLGGELAPVPLWALLGAGLLGSYTTVSAFALQAQGMASGGSRGRAGGYVAISVVLCLLAAALGARLGAAVAG